MCFLNLFKKKPDYEMPSPKKRALDAWVRLADEQDGTTTLTVKGLKHYSYVTSVPNTNSMEPLIDEGVLVVNEPVDSVSDLIIGDVITYERPPEFGGGHIIHTIVNISKDSKGWFCETQAANPKITAKDPYKVRANWVKYVLRSIIW